MAGIRPFVEGDVSRVADLVWKILHEQQGPAPSSLKAYVDKLFLRNPWVDQSICSLVYEDSEGKVTGFFGVVPRPMSIQGKTVRLAFGSNFVVETGSRASFAAMQLVSAFMKGPQDISITDSATEGARQVLRSMGFTVVPIYSLLWARPLRPSMYALHGVARLKKSKVVATIGTFAQPFCKVADYLAATTGASPFHHKTSTVKADVLDADTLIQCLTRIPSKHWLVPAYSLESLEWVLDFVEGRKAYGDLRKIVLRDEHQKIIGWYIYGLNPGGIGEVLQIGAESVSVGKVLDHLFHEAWKDKMIGLHGRLEPQFMEELTLRSSFFLRNGSWTLAHSRKPELLNPIFSGSAFFSRLDGEGCLRFGATQA